LPVSALGRTDAAKALGLVELANLFFHRAWMKKFLEKNLLRVRLMVLDLS
jgi:hypothetical protein